MNHIVHEFRKLPLPIQMRASAHVLADIGVREGVPGEPFDALWNSRDLLLRAKRFQAEDDKRAEVEAAVEELARAFFAASNPHQSHEFGNWQMCTDMARDRARRLYESGWRRIVDET